LLFQLLFEIIKQALKDSMPLPIAIFHKVDEDTYRLRDSLSGIFDVFQDEITTGWKEAREHES
jgi:hypothetical protein